MAVIPDTNVNLATNIRDVLNAAGGSVTNDVTTFFTTAANINKWSKYKPVSYKSDLALTEQEFKLANYGLSSAWVGKTTTAKALLEEAAKGTDFYPYVRPTGDADSPYRLSDFVNYSTTAEAPYIVECPDSREASSFPTTIPYFLSENTDQYSLKITDIAAFENVSNQKLGVVYTPGDGMYYFFYSAKNEGETDTVIESSITAPNAGTYKMIAAWTNEDVLYGATDVTSSALMFTPVPGTYHTCTVSYKAVYMHLSLSNLSKSLYYNSTAYPQTISGFNNIVYYSATFPDGTVPSCEYKFGIYVSISCELGDLNREYYPSGCDIIHSGGSAAVTNKTLTADFPSSITIEEILGETWDSTYPPEVYSITVRYDIGYTSGDGRMYLPAIDPIEVTIV